MGNPMHTGHTNRTQHLGIFDQMDFFSVLCVDPVYQRLPTYFSLPASSNNHYLRFEGLSHKCICHTDTQLHFLWML